MRSARPDDDRKCKIGRDVANTHRPMATAAKSARASQPSLPEYQAPSIPSSRRCSLSRSRLQTSRGGLSSGRGQRDAARSILRSASRHSSGVGRDHDGDVMIGQRRPAIRLPASHKASSVRCRTPPAKTRSACCCPCRSPPQAPERAAAGFFRAWRTEQLMGGEYLVLDRKTRRLVAQQLRDQRQIEPLACLGGAVDHLGDQAFARADEDRFRRRPSSSAWPTRSGQRRAAGPNSIGWPRAGFHLTPHRWQARARQTATKHRRERPTGRHDRGGSRDRPRFRRRYRSSVCRTRNPR